jgi:hypothetical protein
VPAEAVAAVVVASAAGDVGGKPDTAVAGALELEPGLVQADVGAYSH